jgi:hypothetical protein
VCYTCRKGGRFLPQAEHHNVIGHHVILFHMRRVPYQCETCNANFFITEHFIHHLRNAHPDENNIIMTNIAGTCITSTAHIVHLISLFIIGFLWFNQNQYSSQIHIYVEISHRFCLKLRKCLQITTVDVVIEAYLGVMLLFQLLRHRRISHLSMGCRVLSFIQLRFRIFHIPVL